MAKETSVPIKLAATLMLIADRPNLQVLMVRRASKAVFAGSMWVFPGGTVDASDYELTLSSVTLPESIPNADANKQKALYVAAIRETLEEAGVLLGYDKGKLVKTATHASWLNSTRAQLHEQGAASFAKNLRTANISPAFDQLRYFSRWITPVGSPRRFDAYFFSARMPEQLPLQDNSEITHYEWFEPKKALEQNDKKVMAMMTPTLAVLSACASFERTDDFFRTLSKQSEDLPARVEIKSGRVLFPGDALYTTSSEAIENGWIRIAPRYPVRVSGGFPKGV